MTTRAAFLGASAATIAAGGALVAPAAAQNVAAGGASVALDPHVTGISRDEFLARCTRGGAAHKQAFIASRPNGAVFSYVRNSLNGYAYGWNEGAGSLHPIVIFNGLGVTQGIGDAGWAQYRLADVLANAGAPLRNPQAGKNPWLGVAAPLATGTDISSPFAQSTALATLVARGTDFFLCDTALGTLALAVVTAGVASDPNAVKADLRKNLAPGVTLVPSGASALDCALSHGFTFYDANV